MLCFPLEITARRIQWAAAQAWNDKLQKKNIIVLYDEKFTYIKTVYEHINSFRRHSENNIFYLPATIIGGDTAVGFYFYEDQAFDLLKKKNTAWNLEIFDVVVIHYSVRFAVDGYLAPVLREAIKNYVGEKVLFIQDEYEGVQTSHRYISELGITTIFTCVPPSGHEVVYPQSEFPGLELRQTLTGYVPEDPGIEQYALPMEDRELLIGYRGRKLPHHYGMLGYEKYIIGERMREEAQKRSLYVDIESDDSKRIYGSWYAFLGSCRATLGTESGANIFDFDGSLKKLADELADRPFEEVYEPHFKVHDNIVHMNQISPKFFEAIRLGTALVCFPGTYSGILKADRHYIPLEKDFSNVDDVFEKLQNLSYLKELTERAYEEIVASSHYSYKSFVGAFDGWLDDKILEGKYEIVCGPIAIRRAQAIEPISHKDPRDQVLNTTILGGSWQREEFTRLFELRDDEGSLRRIFQDLKALGSKKSRKASMMTGRHHWILKLVPSKAKKVVRKYAENIQEKKASGSLPLGARVLRTAWRLMPESVRQRVGRRIFK